MKNDFWKKRMVGVAFLSIFITEHLEQTFDLVHKKKRKGGHVYGLW